MFAHGINRKIFRVAHPLCAPTGNLSLKTPILIGLITINRKCNCKSNVSSRKLAILKTVSSGKVALPKTYITAFKK